MNGSAGFAAAEEAGFVVAGVVLAAGASSRMGSPKALLVADGETFLARIAKALRQGGCDLVLAVTASSGGAVAAEARRGGCTVVVNPGGSGGQIGSLRAALEQLGARRQTPDGAVRPGRQAVVFTPVDNPFVEHGTVRSLIAAWRGDGALSDTLGSKVSNKLSQARPSGPERGASQTQARPRDRPSIVLPRYGNRRGHPVLADMAVAREFLARRLPEGARTVVRRDPGRVREVVVADPGVVDDIDTPARYAERAGSPV